jgi:pilus assembly protein Flp/PilA
MVPYVIASVWNLLDREAEGQGLVEYGLVIILVSIVAMSALKAVGGSITALFMEIVAAMKF